MILVTGANSLLGVNVIKELLKSGHHVTGLMRRPQDFVLPYHPNLRILKGDITKIEDIERAIAGCEYILHIAAITDQNISKYAVYHHVNVTCTETILQLAIKHKIKRLIYVSSANTIGFGTATNIGNEDIPIQVPFTQSMYAKSKHSAQQLLLMHASEKTSPEIVVVNPTFMLGAYDSKPSSGKIILMAYGKKLIFYPPGGKNFIHVEDAANGIVNAILNARNGNTYLLAGHNLSYKEFYSLLNEHTGQKAILIKVPKLLLLTFGVVGSALQFAGIKTSISLNNMRILCINNYYTNQKAVNELGLTIKPIHVAVTDSIAWFKNSNKII